MTVTNATKKIEKLTGGKVQIDTHNLHSVIFNGHYIAFYPNGRMSPEAEATCFHTQRVGAEHVTYHENISQAFKFVARKNQN